MVLTLHFHVKINFKLHFLATIVVYRKEFNTVEQLIPFYVWKLLKLRKDLYNLFKEGLHPVLSWFLWIFCLPEQQHKLSGDLRSFLTRTPC